MLLLSGPYASTSDSDLEAYLSALKRVLAYFCEQSTPSVFDAAPLCGRLRRPWVLLLDVVGPTGGSRWVDKRMARNGLSPNAQIQDTDDVSPYTYPGFGRAVPLAFMM